MAMSCTGGRRSISPPNSRPSYLPLPTGQCWVHAVDNVKTWKDALWDDTLTAIETDLVMGTTTSEMKSCSNNGSSNNDRKATTNILPVMAHPPETCSDLSMEHAMILLKDWITSTKKKNIHHGLCDEDARIINCNKVIKLDFKDRQTVEPTLQQIVMTQKFHEQPSDDDTTPLRTQQQLFFFLNADILPGPGRRDASCVSIDPDYFLTTCLKYIQLQQQSQEKQQQQEEYGIHDDDADYDRATTSAVVQFGLSLGYKTDYSNLSDGCYTRHDVQSMKELLNRYRHEIQQHKIGAVLALNARILERNLEVFDDFLTLDFPTPATQLLLWTGKGEPPIPQAAVNRIKQHYVAKGVLDRIGFDCQVVDTASSSSAKEQEHQQQQQQQQHQQQPKRKEQKGSKDATTEIAPAISESQKRRCLNPPPEKIVTTKIVNDYEDPERHRLEVAFENAVLVRHFKESIHHQRGCKEPATQLSQGKDNDQNNKCSFFLPHDSSIGVGKFDLSKDELCRLKDLSASIVNAIRGEGVTWGDIDDDNEDDNNGAEEKEKHEDDGKVGVDPRRRMYGFLNRQALIDSGIKIQAFGRRDDSDYKEHKYVLHDASVDLKVEYKPASSLAGRLDDKEEQKGPKSTTGSTDSTATDDRRAVVITVDLSNKPSIAETLYSITEKVHALVPHKYKQYVTMENLIAVQPNLHNGASYLPAHLDFPRLDGFGVVIVTLAIRGKGTVVLIDDGDDDDGDDPSSKSKIYAFDVEEGQSYLLCGDARNKCTHGVICERSSNGACTRETLNLRYGLHTEDFAYTEIDQHWG
jgi:Uncharacterized conserved protein (DUF2181)